MRIALLFVLIASTLTSCVSKKKYAELEAQLETYQTQGNVVESMKKARDREIEAAHAQIQDMEAQMQQMHEKFKEEEMREKITDISNMTPEQIEYAQRLMAEEAQQRDMTRDEGFEGAKTNEAINKNGSEMRALKAAIEGAMSNYAEPDVSIIGGQSKLVVAVADNVLFSEGKESLSAKGETFLNRLTAAMQQENDLSFHVMGITGATSAENLNKASAKAVVASDYLSNKEGVKEVTTVGSQPCDMSYSNRKTSCNRTEFIFEFDYDEILSTHRFGRWN